MYIAVILGLLFTTLCALILRNLKDVRQFFRILSFSKTLKGPTLIDIIANSRKDCKFLNKAKKYTFLSPLLFLFQWYFPSSTVAPKSMAPDMDSGWPTISL